MHGRWTQCAKLWETRVTDSSASWALQIILRDYYNSTQKNTLSIWLGLKNDEETQLAAHNNASTINNNNSWEANGSSANQEIPLTL